MLRSPCTDAPSAVHRLHARRMKCKRHFSLTISLLQTFQMQNKGFPVPTTAYGNSTAQMNRDIRVYLQALVNINLLVSYHIIQLLLLQNPALKRHWDRRDPEIMVPFYSKSLPYSTGTKSECPWFSMARMETDRNLLKLGHLFQAKLLTCRKKTKKRSRYGFLLIESFNIFLSEIQVWKKICEKTSNNFGSAQCVSFSECPSAPNPAPQPPQRLGLVDHSC